MEVNNLGDYVSKAYDNYIDATFKSANKWNFFEKNLIKFANGINSMFADAGNPFSGYAEIGEAINVRPLSSTKIAVKFNYLDLKKPEDWFYSYKHIMDTYVGLENLIELKNHILEFSKKKDDVLNVARKINRFAKNVFKKHIKGVIFVDGLGALLFTDSKFFWKSKHSVYGNYIENHLSLELIFKLDRTGGY